MIEKFKNLNIYTQIKLFGMCISVLGPVSVISIIGLGDYATVAILMSWVSLLSPIAAFGISPMFLRFTVINGKIFNNRVTQVFVILFYTSICSGVLLAFLYFINYGLNFIIICLPILMFSVFREVLLLMFEYDKQKNRLLLMVIYIPFFFIGSRIICWLLYESINLLILTYVVEILCIMLLPVKGNKLTKVKSKFKVARIIFQRSRWFLFSGLLNSLQSRLLLTIVTFLSTDPALVTLYYLVLRIFEIGVQAANYAITSNVIGKYQANEKMTLNSQVPICFLGLNIAVICGIYFWYKSFEMLSIVALFFFSLQTVILSTRQTHFLSYNKMFKIPFIKTFVGMLVSATIFFTLLMAQVNPILALGLSSVFGQFCIYASGEFLIRASVKKTQLN